MLCDISEKFRWEKIIGYSTIFTQFWKREKWEFLNL